MISDTIRRHPVAAFFLLAYGFSWSLWATAMLLYPPSLPPVERAPALALGVLGTFGPFVAAVAVALATGTFADLKARLLRWRVPARWYVVALGVPVTAVAVSYGAYRLFGGAPVDPSRAVPPSALIAVFVFTLLAGGGNEEPGWRGFALPRLQRRYGPTTGTVALAVLWAGWHLPAFLDPASAQSLVPPVAWAGGVLALSFVLTWLFNVADGSVPVVAILHAAFNVAALWVMSGLPADATGGFYWIGVAVLGAFAAALVLATRTDLGFAGDPGVVADGGRISE